MASTLGSMRSLVQADIGGRNDAAALLVIDHGINLAILLATILFKPVELRASLDATYTASAESISLSSYNWIDILKVRDITNSYDLRFIPFNLIDRIVSDSLTTIKYYSLYGTNFYVRKIPTINTSIRIFYLPEPTKLTVITDPIPFSGFDGFIKSVATASVFAAFEEKDASDMWNSITSQLIDVLSIGVDLKATFGSSKAYLDQMISITQGKGSTSGK